jgi:hypothetical protein
MLQFVRHCFGYDSQNNLRRLLFTGQYLHLTERNQAFLIQAATVPEKNGKEKSSSE